ncbi:MAG: 1-acyl-sn-glycerol-3-phosphate acyltransferase [Ardenticatenaceae bacterium]|nr:1-acyl-sn-glycerol-3-phosphate acyltransferase [Ardenticatenaceae bacterium]
MSRYILRAFLYTFAYIVTKLFVSLQVIGRENVPEKGPLIVISNHFSLFEPPLTGLTLPYVPVYMAAAELQDHWLVRRVIQAYDAIPIWRGQVDREALKKALQVLADGGVVGIMPEGGVLPEWMEAINAGEQVHDVPFEDTGRASAQLIEARPGVGYLAARSAAQILPIAFLGTEKLAANMKRWRRTKVLMIIGRPFGPVTLDGDLHGVARRQRIDELGDLMMHHLAELLPPENRGVYG